VAVAVSQANFCMVEKALSEGKQAMKTDDGDAGRQSRVTDGKGRAFPATQG
jgi:hypothetical protein